MGLRLLRTLLEHRRFKYVLALAAAIVAHGAIAIYAVEVGGRAHPIARLRILVGRRDGHDGGYGDVSPSTTEAA